MTIKTLEKKALVLKANEYDRMSLNVPKSFLEAAGMLSHKKKELYAHLKKVRKEWERNGSKK